MGNIHTSSKQSKYKYTMKITGLIASTMLLLMASAPSGLLASPESGDILSDYKNQVEQELLRSVDILDPLPHLTLMDQSCSYPRRSGTCNKMFRRHVEESLHSFHLRISLILVWEYKRLSILQMDR